MKKHLSLLACMFLGFCAPDTVIHGTCAPIYISRQDLTCMSRVTKQKILTHNETWQEENK